MSRADDGLLASSVSFGIHGIPFVIKHTLDAYLKFDRSDLYSQNYFFYPLNYFYIMSKNLTLRIEQGKA